MKEGPSAIRKDSTPPTHRVSFKSSPADGFQTPEVRKPLFDTMSTTSSTVSSTPPTLCVENIDAWKKAAAAEGLSLEDYMEKMSAKNLEESLEEHMRALAAEATNVVDGENKKDDEKEDGKKEDDEKEDDEQEDDGSASSEDETGSDKGDKAAAGVTGKSDSEGEDEESEEESAESEESDSEESEVPLEEFETKLDELVDTSKESEKEKEKKIEKEAKDSKSKVLEAVESQKKSTNGFETANSNLKKGYYVQDGMGGVLQGLRVCYSQKTPENHPSF